MKSGHCASSLGIAAGVFALATAASAQVQVDVNVAAPPPPQVQIGVAPPPPQPVYVQQPQPVYVQQPQPVYVQQPGYGPPPGYMPGPPDTGRFRFGTDASLGYAAIAGYNVGAAGGFGLGLGLRLGWQLNNAIAIYYQGNIPIGFVGGTGSDGVSRAGIYIGITNALVGEYTFANVVHLGLGPSLDFLLGGICGGDRTSGGSRCVGAAGTYIGAHARIAATIGGWNNYGRRGFSIGLDLHPTFTPDSVYFSALLGVGYEFY